MLFICASMKPSTVCFYESVIKSNQDNMFCALPTSAFMHVHLCSQTFTHEKHEQGWAPPFLFMFSEVMTLASSNLLGDITTWCCLLSECTTRPNSLSFRFYSFLIWIISCTGICTIHWFASAIIGDLRHIGICFNHNLENSRMPQVLTQLNQFIHWWCWYILWVSVSIFTSKLLVSV